MRIACLTLLLLAFPAPLGAEPAPSEAREGQRPVASAPPSAVLLASTIGAGTNLTRLDLPQTRAPAQPPAPAAAVPAPDPGAERPRVRFARDVCARIVAAAGQHDLPPHFLARLIWKESRFDPQALSPKGARGIAQFMPGTAAEWGLEDPHDPHQAIGKSAQFLGWLRDKFGNLGLAAAGYNAGHNRVSNWLAGEAQMPLETRGYVLDITGRNIEEWKERQARFPIPAIGGDASFDAACVKLASRQIRLASRQIRLRSHGTPKALAKTKNWGVTIAQGDTRDTALRALGNLRQRHPTLIGRSDTRIIELRLAGKAHWTFNVAQIPSPSREAANNLCRRLTREGVFCLVRAY